MRDWVLEGGQLPFSSKFAEAPAAGTYRAPVDRSYVATYVSWKDRHP
jgi:hypothetical protein